MNIRLRLTLWYTAILLLILVIFSVIVYLGLSRSLLVALDDHLQREAAQLIGEITFEREQHEIRDNDDEAERSSTGEFKQRVGDVKVELAYIPEEGVLWRILTAEGQPIFDPGFFDGTDIAPTLTETGRVRLDYAVLANDTPVRLYTAPFVIEERGEGIVQVAESYQHIRDVQRQLVFLLALSLPLTLLFTSAGGWFLAARALAPIDRITRSAQQISADDLHRRLDLNLPNDEVGRLAATFDQMLARLEDAFERQKRFIADASHEMRTPLTILKGDVEVALNRPRSAREYQQTLRMVNQTTDRLASLVEELFVLARADSRQYPLEAKQIDLSSLLRTEVSHLLTRAVSHGVSLDLAAPARLPLVADPDKLSRLFINLIDNAIKYSNAGDTVTITAQIEAGQARVEVADTGPGISSEHMTHLFERFYRVDKARSRQGAVETASSGAGLGLSIAKWLAQVHGGRIEVSSEVGRGTRFTVWLPLEPGQR